MSVLVALALAGITIFFGYRDPRNRAIRDWGWSTLATGIGLALLMTRGLLPVVISEWLADTLILAGVTLSYRSIRVYRGEPTRDPAGWAVVAAASLALAVSGNAVPNPSVRSAAVSVILGALMWRIGWLAGWRPQPDALISQRYTAFTYGLFGAVFMVRSVNTLLRRGDGFSLMNGGWIEAATIGGVTMLWVSATLGIMWMTIERQQGELLRFATRDALTDALNRHALAEAIEHEKSRAARKHGSFAIALFDIDHFKAFNDTYGHLTGDRVLRELVVALRSAVRMIDPVGRYGGEEFVLVLPDANLEAGMIAAERARRRVEAEGFMVDGRAVPLTVSAGVAVFPEDGTDWDGLLAAADAALYRAKAGGRNRVAAPPRIRTVSAAEAVAPD